MAHGLPKYRRGWSQRERGVGDDFYLVKTDQVRRGRGPATTPAGIISNRSPHRISPNILYQAKITSPYIRPCVDSMTRTLRGMPWDVVPVDGTEPVGAQLRARDELVGLFDDPNSNKGGWPEFIAKVGDDLLTYDAAAIEIARGIMSGKPQELVPLYGPSIIVEQDNFGYLKGYKQKLDALEDAVDFEPDELIYLAMYASTRSPYGVSIIQTCVDQIAYLLLAADAHCRFLDKDEIPEGIMFMSGVGEDEFKKAMARIRKDRGKRDAMQWLSSQAPEAKMDWIHFNRANRDQQVLEVTEAAERIIVRNFGQDQLTAGLTRKHGSRAEGEVQVATTESSLTRPICEFISGHININVVKTWPNAQGLIFKFIYPKTVSPETARAHQVYIQRGAMTVNESRSAIGKEPYRDAPYADRPFYQVGTALFFLDDGSVINTKPEQAKADPPKNEPDKGSHSHTRDAIMCGGDSYIDAKTAQLAKDAGHEMADKIQDLIEQYHKELQAAFDNFGREVIAVSTAGLLGRGTPELTRTERDLKVKQLQALRDKYLGIWQATLAQYAPRAGKIGHDRAMLTVLVSQLGDEARRALLDKYVKENQAYMKEAWRRYLDKVIWVVNRITKGMKGPGGLPDNVEFETVGEFAAAEEAAMAASFSSVEAYSKYLWALENVVFGKEGDAAGGKVLWHSVSGNPCPSCDSVAGQVWSYKDLSFYPGIGTQCNGRCYCFLEIILPEQEGPKL